jgi:hypothetical protein
MGKPYIIVRRDTGKVVSRFASLDNCTKRCDYLISKGFNVKQDCLLTFEQAMEKARYERLMRPVNINVNNIWSKPL